MSESLRLRSLLAMGVSAAAILSAAPAFAQGSPTATSNQPATVGEVVVTAQKREEAIQDVPIAVSAFSQDTLEKAKIEGGPNLVLAIPNVNFSKGNFTGYNFQIRGVGSKLVSASGDAGTGIHLNNAPMTANNLFESEFYDVERVEVLRGPQGTLYGRNATGGVVNVITAKPVDHFQAMIRAEVGNYNTRKFRGMVNVPLGDMFALRVAGTTLKRDGYGTNLYTGNDADDRDLWAARVTLGFNPSERVRTYLMYDHFEEDDNRSRIGRQFCVKDTGGTMGGLTFPNTAAGDIQRGFFSQGCLETSLYAPGASTGALNTQGTLGGLFSALTGIQTGDALAGKVQDANIRNIESVIDPVYQTDTDIWELNIEADLTDALKLTSLTSYSKLNLFTEQDYNRMIPTVAFNATPNSCNFFTAPCGNGALAAGLPISNGLYSFMYGTLFPGGVVSDPQVGAQNRFTTLDISSAYTKQWTQEIRLQSNFDGPINFNVGGIYLDFKYGGDYFVMFNSGTGYYQVLNLLTNLASGGAVPYPCPQNNPACTYIDPSKTPDRSGHNYYDNYGPYHLKSRAAFGEVYYQMTDNLKWTLGLRYTDDSKTVEAHQVSLGEKGSGVLPPPVSDPDPLKKVQFKETTGRFGVDWKPHLDFTDETLVYAFYSKGYKAGGINPACSFACNTYPQTFAPEFVNAIEIGTKNTLMDGSVLLNLTGFHYKYEGYQVSKIQNRTSINENIDAKIKGLELETIWTPIRALRLNANVGWLDTEITGGQSIDTFNRTQGDPNLVVMKTDAAANCVVSVTTAQTALFVANLYGSPFFLLGACPGDAPAPPPGTTLYPGGPLASGIGSYGLFSEGVPVNLNGKELPNSPHWTLSVGAQYTMDLGPDWTATLRGDYYKQTKTFSRIYNSEADRIKDWDNVNATLTFDNDPMKLSVELYVKNATDEEAITDTYLTDDSSGLYRNAFFTEPRTYGLAITKKF